MVLKKSSDAQKARIEKKAEQRRTEKKAAEKKADKKAKEERLQKTRTEKGEKLSSKNEETETISANSIEELMQKIGDFAFTQRSNSVQTESELQVGQNIDFRG